jgi:HD-GYP domain-containing protein (c-di-GMP phosphodiesterase class II)
MGPNRRDRGLLLLAGLALLASLGYLLYRALGGANSLIDRDFRGPINPGDTFEALPWLIVAAVAGAVALTGWYLASRRAADAKSAHESRRKAEAEAERARSDAAEQGERAERAEQERSEDREQLERMRRAHDEQRRWNRELSAKLTELHHREGALGGRGDVRTLVLRVAMSLLEAEKGLLLSRKDEDGDGNLDVVAHEGFDADPTESALVQRFAGEVVERDEIVRIGRDELPEKRPEDADEEIDNLVAIPIYIADRFHGVVVCANGDALEHDDEVLVALGDHAGAILENSRLHGELRGSYVATVKMLADAIEVKDPFLRGHSDEVSGLVRAMATRLELESDRREQLIFGSLLHDIGKIGVSERILLKPGPLTDEEFSAIKLHPRIGYRLVAQVPLLQPVAAAILHHHERYDGTGYPSGLAGERIPLEARVIAIIAAFCALISDRPYQEAVPVEDALAELERCAGTHFDPHLVKMFVEEVRSGIPEDEDPSMSLADALDDPELQALRGEFEPMAGFGSFASTDSLTLLRSHSAFRERLSAEAARAALDGGPDGLALILIRVANLAELNEELGYGATDRLLEQLARQVDRTAVDCGGAAGREGGSLLAVLAPGTDAAAAEAAGERLRGRCPERLRLEIAVSSWTDGMTAEGMLGAAAARLSLP